jgi:hypothetical protein
VEKLFDRAKDPDERTDLAAAKPDVLRRFRRLLQEYRGTTRPSPLVDAASSRLDQETRNRLRALGYMD